MGFNEYIIPGDLKLRLFCFFKNVRLKLFPEHGTPFSPRANFPSLHKSKFIKIGSLICSNSEDLVQIFISKPPNLKWEQIRWNPVLHWALIPEVSTHSDHSNPSEVSPFTIWRKILPCTALDCNNERRVWETKHSSSGAWRISIFRLVTWIFNASQHCPSQLRGQVN